MENEYCPDHGEPDNPWPCPEDDDSEGCAHFSDEIERRLDEMKIKGNYTRVWRDDQNRHWRQEYRNHVPTSSPKQVRLPRAY